MSAVLKKAVKLNHSLTPDITCIGIYRKACVRWNFQWPIISFTAFQLQILYPQYPFVQMSPFTGFHLLVYSPLSKRGLAILCCEHLSIFCRIWGSPSPGSQMATKTRISTRTNQSALLIPLWPAAESIVPDIIRLAGMADANFTGVNRLRALRERGRGRVWVGLAVGYWNRASLSKGCQ